MGVLRVLLALAVVNGHTHDAAYRNFISGGESVKLFFVISGFYMALILDGKYSDPILFYSNRFLRLFPSYFFVLLLSIAWFQFTWYYIGHRPPPLWVAAANEEMHLWQWCLFQIANLTMVGLDIPALFHWKSHYGFYYLRYPPGDVAPNGAEWVGWMPWIWQGWSIGAEIWFYMLAPFILKNRIALQIVLALVSLSLMMLVKSAGIDPYYLFPANLWIFIAGSLLYNFYKSSHFIRDMRFGLAFLLFDIGAISLLGLTGDPIRTILLVLMAVSTPFLFVSFSQNKGDALLGELSYPIYLAHMLIISILVAVFHMNSPVIAAICCLIASTAIVQNVELPLDKFRQWRVQNRRTI